MGLAGEVGAPGAAGWAPRPGKPGRRGIPVPGALGQATPWPSPTALLLLLSQVQEHASALSTLLNPIPLLQMPEGKINQAKTHLSGRKETSTYHPGSAGQNPRTA